MGIGSSPGRLIVVLAAALAIAGSSAPGAGASVFDADAELPATIEGPAAGEGPVFSFQGNKVVCNHSSLTGTLSEAAETLTVEPSFSECTAFGFVGATVSPNGCKLVLHAGSEIGAEEGLATEEFSGTADVSCETGKSLEIVAATCKVKIGSQTGLSSLKYANQAESAPETFDLDASLASINSSITSGFLCPLTTKAGDLTGTLSGSWPMSGKSGAENVSAEVKGRPTRLCSELQMAGVCKANKSYTGPIEGILIGAPAKMTALNGIGEELGKIECAGSVMKGNFQRTGASSPNQGISTFKFETPGHEGRCTSTLAGNPDVLIFMSGRPYTASVFEYLPGGGATGRLRFAKAKVQGIAVSVEIGENPCDYRRNSVEGTVTNGGAETKLKLNLNWPLFEGKGCPASINWTNLEWSLTRTGGLGGPLLLAQK